MNLRALLKGAVAVLAGQATASQTPKLSDLAPLRPTLTELTAADELVTNVTLLSEFYEVVDAYPTVIALAFDGTFSNSGIFSNPLKSKFFEHVSEIHEAIPEAILMYFDQTEKPGVWNTPWRVFEVNFSPEISVWRHGAYSGEVAEYDDKTLGYLEKYARTDLNYSGTSVEYRVARRPVVKVSNLSEANDHIVHHPDIMLVLLNANRATTAWLRITSKEYDCAVIEDREVSKTFARQLGVDIDDEPTWLLVYLVTDIRKFSGDYPALDQWLTEQSPSFTQLRVEPYDWKKKFKGVFFYDNFSDVVSIQPEMEKLSKRIDKIRPLKARKILDFHYADATENKKRMEKLKIDAEHLPVFVFYITPGSESLVTRYKPTYQEIELVVNETYVLRDPCCLSPSLEAICRVWPPYPVCDVVY